MNTFNSNMSILGVLNNPVAKEKVGDAAAAAIEKLKSSAGLDAGFQQNIPAPKVSPDTSVQLGTGTEEAAPPALNPAWAAQGITPPSAGNPEYPNSVLGYHLNKIRELGPDWKSIVQKQNPNW